MQSSFTNATVFYTVDGAVPDMSSTLLFDWRPWQIVTNDSGTVLIKDPGVNDLNWRFYRAVVR